MENVIKALEEIRPGINWDNWVEEDTGTYWKVSQVLFAKLDWAIEALASLNEHGDMEEHLDTLTAVQRVIEALQEYEPA